jgi:ubiquinone/menaquinone biosynthesis C-methylase UbiE
LNSKFLGQYPKLKWKVYHIYRFFHDLSYSIRKNKNNLCPSGRTFVGDGNFVEIGNEFFQYFIDLCNVKRSAKILDLGSGMGRMAIPFTKYLDQNGIYCGFDVFKSGIQWSQKYITSQFSNFNFTHFDIYNKEYNPDGKISPTKFTFPYDDNYFDLVFATSVFTHLLPSDLPHYFSEINRVTKPNGVCLLTFLLLNEESMKLVQEKKSKILFEHYDDNHALMLRNIPEHTIAYDENFIHSIYNTTNLVISDPIHYGSWCGRDKFKSSQDIIISIKQN